MLVCLVHDNFVLGYLEWSVCQTKLFFVPRKRSSSCVKVTELPIGYSNASKTVMCIFTVNGSGVMVSIMPNILQIDRSRRADYLSCYIMLNNVLLESY